jgi:hypothetical protein
MPDDNQNPTPERKVTVTESKVQPPDPAQMAAAGAAVKRQMGSAQEMPTGLTGPQQANSVLDTKPDEEPYRTDDARTSLGELLLVGGFIDIGGNGEQTLLNRVVLREMSGHEEDMLTNSKIDLSRRFQNILAECMERIGDGKGKWITDKSKMHGIVDGLTIGDRSQMLLHLRIISVYPDGETYTFRVNCGNCGNEIRHTVDLSKCKQEHMPNAMMRVYDETLPSLKTVRCRVMLGRHERIVDEAQQVGQNILSAAIMARVLEINGKPATMASIKDLSTKDRSFLRQKFDDIEGGIETTTMIRCGNCGSRFEGEIDISQRDFFFPSGKSKN